MSEDTLELVEKRINNKNNLDKYEEIQSKTIWKLFKEEMKLGKWKLREIEI